MTITVKHVLPASVVAVTAFTYSLLAAFPPGAIQPPGLKEYRPAILTIAPQGWAFFTKSPRDPRVEPFKIERDGAIPISAWPAGQDRYLFGISREGRSQGLETGILSQGPAAEEWHECLSNQPVECAREDTAKAIATVNEARRPSICGDIVLVEMEHVSWAYRNMTKQTSKALKSAHLKVACPNA